MLKVHRIIEGIRDSKRDMGAYGMFFAEWAGKAVKFDLRGMGKVLGDEDLGGQLRAAPVVVPFGICYFESEIGEYSFGFLVVSLDELERVMSVGDRGVIEKEVGESVVGVMLCTLWDRELEEAGVLQEATVISQDMEKGCLTYSNSALESDEAEFMSVATKSLSEALVLMSAGLVESETVRASEKLNKKRKKRGKLPLFDYKVLKLNRKRVRYESGGGGEGSPKRLHLRRAHNRVYYRGTDREFVRKIPAMLVGQNKDGFVHKDYEL